MDSTYSPKVEDHYALQEMGGDYQGYRTGDFPVTESVVTQLIFLPVFSQPTKDAAAQVVAAIRKVSAYADQL